MSYSIPDGYTEWTEGQRASIGEMIDGAIADLRKMPRAQSMLDDLELDLLMRNQGGIDISVKLPEIGKGLVLDIIDAEINSTKEARHQAIIEYNVKLEVLLSIRGKVEEA